MQQAPSKVFQLTLTPAEKADLRKLAQIEGATMRAVLRRLIREAAGKKQADLERRNDDQRQREGNGE